MASTPRKRGTPSAPKDETKSAKFSRLASKRVTKACKAVANIGNLSGGGYEYTEDQVKAIGQYLKDAVNAALARFENKGAKAASEIKI